MAHFVQAAALSFDSIYATRESALSNQSGIESCRGRFIELNQAAKRSMMQRSSKHPWRFGVRLRATYTKATYRALRRIAVTFHKHIVELSSKLQLVRPLGVAACSKLDGIVELQGLNPEPIRQERNMPQSRYLSSSIGSQIYLWGRRHD